MKILLIFGMPKVRTNRVKYPNGWELIEPTLRDLETKMREGMDATTANLFYFFSEIWYKIRVLN